MGHISGTWELLLCEYWRKRMIIGEKNTDLKRLTGRLKLCFLTEIGRLHWNQGEEVAHFAWFGEPCMYVFIDSTEFRNTNMYMHTLTTEFRNTNMYMYSLTLLSLKIQICTCIHWLYWVYKYKYVHVFIYICTTILCYYYAHSFVIAISQTHCLHSSQKPVVTFTIPSIVL